MKVLVLGASGFLGRHLVAALAASGWATPIAGVRRRGDQPVEQLVIDATDVRQVAAALAGVDAAINCVTGSDATIVNGARALFAGPASVRIVHLSSMAVYGDATGRVAEDAPLVGTGNYVSAKIAAERLAAARGGVTVLRPGCIYGGGSPQWTVRIADLLRVRRIGDLGAKGDGCSNIIHVDDVAAAILSVLRDPASDGAVLNLAMPGAPDWNGYFLAFARALGAVPLATVPGWRIGAEALAAVPLKLAERAGLPVPPAIPPSLARLWSQDIRLDTTAARRALPDVAWTPLGAGVAEAAVSLTPASDRVHRPRATG